MKFVQYKQRLPLYSNNLLIREQRKLKYLSIGNYMYNNPPKLTKEIYLKLRDDYNNGDEIAIELLIDLSISHIIESVADIYAKFDLDNVVSYEEAVSSVLEDFIKSIRNFEYLPRFYSEYSQNVVNKFAFSVIIRIYRSYAVRTNVNVPIPDEKATLLIDEQDSEEFPMHLIVGESGIINDILNANYLNDREKQIILLKYGFNGEPKTYLEISQQFNVSLTRVQQILHYALEKISARTKIEKYI